MPLTVKGGYRQTLTPASRVCFCKRPSSVVNVPVMALLRLTNGGGKSDAGRRQGQCRRANRRELRPCPPRCSLAGSTPRLRRAEYGRHSFSLNLLEIPCGRHVSGEASFPFTPTLCNPVFVSPRARTRPANRTRSASILPRTSRWPAVRRHPASAENAVKCWPTPFVHKYSRSLRHPPNEASRKLAHQGWLQQAGHQDRYCGHGPKNPAFPQTDVRTHERSPPRVSKRTFQEWASCWQRRPRQYRCAEPAFEHEMPVAPKTGVSGRGSPAPRPCCRGFPPCQSARVPSAWECGQP